MGICEKRIFHVAAYYRLSNEDDEVLRHEKSESTSITNQRKIVLDYLSGHDDLVLQKEYIDDGVSGSSFSRPAFNCLIKDIEMKAVDCVVVKDLSRFGREYIDAGTYLERVFPRLGVRFISVNDSIDTAKGMDTLLLALKNILNDAYCRDISVKTRSNLAIKRKHGEFIGAFAVYGYEKDYQNKNQLVIDEYAGNIVRSIFAWRIRGQSCKVIAQKLNKLGVLSPYDYKKHRGYSYSTTFKQQDNSVWYPVTVRRILENEIYTGTLIQGRYSTVNHKVKKVYQKQEEEWIKVQNAHEALVSIRDFEIVQKALQLDSRTPPGEMNCYPLSGILTCGKCGAGMVRRPRTVGGRKYVYYECREYVSSHGKHCCANAVNESMVEKLLLELLQYQVELALKLDRSLSESDIVNITGKDRECLQYQESLLKKELINAEELLVCIKNDLSDGIITEEDFVDFSEEFEIRRKTLIQSLKAVADEIRELDSKSRSRFRFIDDFVKYRDVQQLDRVMVVELVDEIVVYDKEHMEIRFCYQDRFMDMVKLAEMEANSSKVDLTV